MKAAAFKFLLMLGIAGTAEVRADGIAVSTDGEVWLPGAGTYGKGWGGSGQGVTVEEDGTLYIRFYASFEREGCLYIAPHGTPWGKWTITGPSPTRSVGCAPNAPVLLQITKAGTKRSQVTWINAPDRSRSWPGPIAPGVYDLALGRDAMWTVPPINITARPSWWQSLLGVRTPTLESAPPSYASVPDNGCTAAYLAMALSALIALMPSWLNRRS